MLSPGDSWKEVTRGRLFLGEWGWGGGDSRLSREDLGAGREGAVPAQWWQRLWEETLHPGEGGEGVQRGSQGGWRAPGGFQGFCFQSQQA